MLHKGQGFQSSWPAALTGKHTCREPHHRWEANTVIPPYLWGIGTQDPPQILKCYCHLSWIITHNTTSEDAEPIDVEGRL